VSQSDPKQIICKHFADSLFVASRCPDEGRIVDLGSGAGFPGLPIAIARPKSRVCLIESRGKKVSFLEHASQAAAVRNAAILHRRIEGVASEEGFRGSFEIATGRALTSASRFFDMANAFLTPGGQTIAMRSVNEAWSLPPDIEETRYTLPDGSPRRLLIARR
jgi:16S rRNA (guanine527-N7)-methyltransferase